jgi:hypothetical protein
MVPKMNWIFRVHKEVERYVPIRNIAQPIQLGRVQIHPTP